MFETLRNLHDHVVGTSAVVHANWQGAMQHSLAYPQRSLPHPQHYLEPLTAGQHIGHAVVVVAAMFVISAGGALLLGLLDDRA